MELTGRLCHKFMVLQNYSFYERLQDLYTKNLRQALGCIKYIPEPAGD